MNLKQLRQSLKLLKKEFLIRDDEDIVGITFSTTKKGRARVVIDVQMAECAGTFGFQFTEKK